MKKLVLAIATILVCSCGGSNKNESQGKDSVNIEETLTRNESVPDEPTIPDNFKIYADYSDDNGYAADDSLNRIEWQYHVTITCSEDGTASIDTEVIEKSLKIEMMNHLLAEPTDDPIKTRKEHGEGSWKTRNVKRGTKYLTGYDVEIGNSDFYFTEKFDYLYGLKVGFSVYPIRDILRDEDSFYHFDDGKTSYAWKIAKFEAIK